MQITRTQISNWLDPFCAAVNQKHRVVQPVAGLRHHFTEDLQFGMFTAPTFLAPPLDREQSLLTFVHPAVHERLVPRHYVIDAESSTAAVQFKIRFTRTDTDGAWRPLQASAHYGLETGGESGPQIRSIHYWTESHRGEDHIDSVLALWTVERDRCLAEFGLAYLGGGLEHLVWR
jgi:hypothetical protein